MEYWAWWRSVIPEDPSQGRMMSPFFTADKTCDDEFVIEDYWGVPFAVDVFYLSRLFLGEDALIELDIFLWMFG